MKAALWVLICVVAMIGDAQAHRLKLFVTTEQGEIGGYAFFVGGGRPNGAEILIKDQAGTLRYRDHTDAEGGFRWRPPEPAPYHLVVDAGDGHWVEATIGADPPPVPRPSALPDADQMAQQIEQAVDAALARRLRPLLEAYEQAEARLRFNDIMGGLGMIVGLAGIGLWASGKRRERAATEPTP